MQGLLEYAAGLPWMPYTFWFTYIWAGYVVLLGTGFYLVSFRPHQHTSILTIFFISRLIVPLWLYLVQDLPSSDSTLRTAHARGILMNIFLSAVAVLFWIKARRFNAVDNGSAAHA